MELKIISKEKNPFLKRVEMQFEITDSIKTPTRKEVREKISALTNAKQEFLVIEKIDKRFGCHNAFGKARIYESKKELEKTELKPILKRNFPEIKEKQKQQPGQKEEKQQT